MRTLQSYVKPEEKVSFCIWSDVLMSCARTVQFKVYRRYAALSQQTDKLRHERNVSSRSIPAIQVCDGHVDGPMLWCCIHALGARGSWGNQCRFTLCCYCRGLVLHGY